MPGANVSAQYMPAGHFPLLALAAGNPLEAEMAAKGGSTERGHPLHPRETDIPKRAVFTQPGGGQDSRRDRTTGLGWRVGGAGRQRQEGAVSGLGLPVL